jgi:hypothetical protein
MSYKKGDWVILYQNTDKQFLNCKAKIKEDWDDGSYLVDIYTNDDVYWGWHCEESQMRKLTKLDKALQ